MGERAGPGWPQDAKMIIAQFKPQVSFHFSEAQRTIGAGMGFQVMDVN